MGKIEQGLLVFVGFGPRDGKHRLLYVLPELFRVRHGTLLCLPTSRSNRRPSIAKVCSKLLTWSPPTSCVDLFSRRVVGWSMSAAMTAQLVTDALVMAIWRRGKPDALLHQYTSEQFQKLMAYHGVVCSMSRSGNVWYNAAMESFFSSLKTERTARKTYRTP
jgi:transposase InsO family protein